ncbi:MAG TPA: hypothetical protein VGM02_01520 [Acidobacteriaceae bacterium]|jgi:hypothetical protein
MKKIINIAVLVLVCFALTAWGLTTVTGQHIINSVIDSTTIGATIPATVRATTLAATAQPLSTIPGNSTYLSWNGTNGAGESDFFDNYGASTGGFYWFATGNDRSGGWSSSAPQMTLNKSGLLFSAGGYTTPSSVTAGSGFFGNLNGNASTATAANTASAFDHTPAGCTGINTFASSIDNAGDLGCGHTAVVRSLVTAACTTGSASYSTCNTPATDWSSPFPAGATVHATCSLATASDPRASVGVLSVVNGTGIIGTIVTEGSVSVTASLECIGVED